MTDFFRRFEFSSPRSTVFIFSSSFKFDSFRFEIERNIHDVTLMLQSTWLINGLVCAARVIHKANGHAFRSSLTDLHRDSSCLITSLTAPPPVPLSVQSNISCGLLPCRLPIKVTHYPGRSTFPLHVTSNLHGFGQLIRAEKAKQDCVHRHRARISKVFSLLFQ